MLVTTLVDPSQPEALIEAWLARQLDDNPAVAHVERDREVRRWYVRLRGDERDVMTVFLTLGQRTLHYETYFMPAPEEHQETLYEYLLRRNARLYNLRFCIGPEDAVYLVGQVPLATLDEAVLDGVLGSTYDAVERYFRPAMRIGYASKFRG